MSEPNRYEASVCQAANPAFVPLCLRCAVPRAPAAGSYWWSEVYGCCVLVHLAVARVPPCGSPAEG
jgi:hypothetical protein